MKYLLAFFAVFLSVGIASAQCRCESDTLMNETISCEKTTLTNGAKLYYQFNCDSVWMVLESTDGKKHIIFSDRELVGLHGYVYRLGYQLIHQFQNALLFRFGCPANGPCGFALVDKNTGKQIETFGQLIFGDEEEDNKDYIIYFSDTSLSKVTLHYIDTDKRYTFKVNAKRFETNHTWHPAYCFSKPIPSKPNTITLTYGNNRHINYKAANLKKAKEDKLVIDLNVYRP
jgi:hypothetical protein